MSRPKGPAAAAASGPTREGLVVSAHGRHCVVETPDGARVAVTGGGNGVFRQTAMEEALTKSFTPEAIADIRTDASEINGDLHGSADYRAHLVGVMAQRAVAKAVA